MMKTGLLALLALWVSIVSLKAQTPVKLEGLNVDNGLSDRLVRRIFRDRQGFLWIGTRNGLNRFDGHNFLIYSSQRPAPYHLSADQVNAIAQTRAGKLAIAYFPKKDGFDLLDPATGGLTPVTFPAQAQMEQFLPTKTGDLFLILRRQTMYSLWQWKEKEAALQQIGQLAHYTPETPALADSKDRLWLSGPEGSGGIQVYDLQSQKTRRLDFSRFEPPVSKINVIPDFFERSDGRIWIAVPHTGIYVYDPAKDRPVLNPALPHDFQYLTLREDAQGNILIQTSDVQGRATGLVLQESSGRLVNLDHLLSISPQNNVFYSNDFTTGWISGTNDGLKWLKYGTPPVHVFLSEINPGVPYGASIRGICSDGRGHLVVSTERQGWHEVDVTTGQSRQLRPGSSLSLGRNLIRATDGSIWGVDNQLIQYSPQTGRFRTLELPWKVEALALSRSGILWLGFKGHIGALDPQTGSFKEWKDTKGAQPLESSELANYLLETRGGDIWIGHSNGLIRIRPAEGSFQLFNENQGLSSAHITCIYERENGDLLLGTLGGGLNLFNPRTGRTEAVLNVENGLANASIAGIVAQDDDHYWISTFAGLSFFDLPEKTFRNFYQQDGFSHDEFNRFSFFNDPQTGDLYFGGIRGVNGFRAADLLKPVPAAPLLLSGLTYFDKNGTSRLTQSHFELQEKSGALWSPPVVLPPDNRFLHLKFALADFRSLAKNQYTYRIEGLDRNWNAIGANGELILNYLPSGPHLLHIKAVGRYGNAGNSELVVPITVLQYWYFRWWAWLLWASLGLGLLAVAYGAREKRLQFRQRYEKEQQEALRLKELNAFKNRLYTDITHEFRTPLTIMMGMARQLEQNLSDQRGVSGNEATDWKTQLRLLERNGQHLLGLVNQMLDLAKAEYQDVKINFIQADILPFLHFIAESFNSLANQQNILLKVESREPELVMDHAPESIRQILSNLLSNALKHTPSGGRVTVEIKKMHREEDMDAGTPEWLLLKVSDTGKGIAPEALPYIFDRFFSAPAEVTPFQKGVTSPNGKNSKTKPATSGLQRHLPQERRHDIGTGIGLALVKELVGLLGGKAAVSSEAGAGTTFSVWLPISRQAAPVSPPVAETAASDAALHPDTLPVLLLVEDNADVVHYLKLCLETHYRLEFAYNGRAGVEKAFAQVPDLILSDVMMPGMDGFDLCHTLKNDPRSSHIPIVLLTARGDVESRIAGLQKGADAYLVKPFYPEELHAVVENLLQLRDRLQSRYQAMAMGENQESVQADVGPEDAFLKQLREVVTAGLANPDLTPQDICRQMSMGHTNLNLKLNALTGMPITLFIRKMRLHSARTLLADNQWSIAEIAYQTGFNDPKYFSRLFAEEYGAPPSAFRKAKG